ncbi:MAG: hypothetical protein HUU55_02480 [Myxococcales bacterium]|nr:hypothetical protein [Myxococcales bacterium]
MVEEKKRGTDGDTADKQHSDNEWASISKRLEKYLPDIMKRSASTAVRSFLHTEEGVRTVISAMLPPKSLHTVTEVLERAKTDIASRFAKEFHDFLGRIDLNKEIQRALTSLSIELRTEIRFIPNDKAVIKPKIETKTRVTRTRPPSRGKQKQPQRRGGQPED